MTHETRAACELVKGRAEVALQSVNLNYSQWNGATSVPQSPLCQCQC